MILPLSLETIVTIPTFNEADNIKELLIEILALDESLGCVIVDDNSPDGTAQIVTTLSQAHRGRIHLVMRQKEKGRASAGLRGLLEATRLMPKYIVQMDADFSHRPEYIKIFRQEIETCDVVLGSRFIPGGTDIDRSHFRRLISVSSAYLLRSILGLKIRDIGSGFKFYRREVLQSLPLNRFYSRGISVSMEEVFRIAKLGYSIREAPIVFAKRRSGSSKLRLGDFLEPIWVSTRLVLSVGRL